MYLFIAHYTNMETGKEITKSIEFDGQFLDNEKACYLYAMGKAYDLEKENEKISFDSLEFIYC